MAEKEIMVDTSILIDYFRKQKKNETRLFRHVAEGRRIAVSSITEFEILKGAKDSHREFWLQMRSFIRVIPFDSKAAQSSAEIVTSLKKLRKSIDIPDLFIAATALTNDLQFDTHNKKHFVNIGNLQLIE